LPQAIVVRHQPTAFGGRKRLKWNPMGGHAQRNPQSCWQRRCQTPRGRTSRSPRELADNRGARQRAAPPSWIEFRRECMD
jgi:hypothetical protein